MKAIRLITAFLFFIPVFSHAQDTLFLLNGKTVPAKIRQINPDSMFVSFLPVDKHKTKLKYYDLQDVYALSFKDSDRIIIYVADTNRGYVMNAEQMGSFINGGQFAKTHYKSPWVTVGGTGIGFAGTYLLPFFWGLTVPTAYCLVMGVTPIHIKKQQEKYPELFNDEYFVAGYKDKAKKKKILNSIIGGVIGIGVSAFTTELLYYLNK
jgi:hypothetical protein